MHSRKSPQFNRSNSRPWLALVCASIIIGSTANIPVLSKPTNLASISGSAKSKTILPSSVLQSIRQAIKKHFKVSQIVVVSATEQNWPSGCLGLPEPLEACKDEIVPGWRIEVKNKLQTWVYRSDRTGKKLRLESLKNLRLKNR
jgi:hypothetical protein